MTKLRKLYLPFILYTLRRFQPNDPITYPVSARESLYFIQLIKIPDERGEKK